MICQRPAIPKSGFLKLNVSSANAEELIDTPRQLTEKPALFARRNALEFACPYDLVRFNKNCLGDCWRDGALAHLRGFASWLNLRLDLE